LYESKKNLGKLINKYKDNIIIEDEKLSSMVNPIIYYSDVEFIINITEGYFESYITINRLIITQLY
jgi:hypothetical protein